MRATFYVVWTLSLKSKQSPYADRTSLNTWSRGPLPRAPCSEEPHTLLTHLHKADSKSHEHICPSEGGWIPV